MKTILVTVSLALASVGSAQAQIFRPSVGNGAIVGAVAGSLIGGHNRDHWAEGAVIGAAAGALIGAAVSPQEPVYSSPPPVYQAPAYGQQVYGQPVYGQGQPVYSQGQPIYQPAPGVPNAAVVPNAPYVEQVPTQVVQAPPQVVYVESAPRVVYMPSPRVVYAPPVFSFGYGIYSGPRYYDRGYYRGGYRPDYGRHHR